MYIFGYGSLVNINSAQKSFKRVLKQEDFIPVVLKGFKKVWNSIEYILFEDEKQISNGIFLNLQKDKKSSTNGVLLHISQEEFEFLKLREKNYSCIKLNSEDFVGLKTKEKIYTFSTTNKEKIAALGDENCFIPKNYIFLLEEGLKNYSKEFQEEFIKSYSNYPFKIKEGTYKFSDPIQNRFAKDGFKDES
ncbi:gamma-glutamylcyclotransferase [Halarcobacter ebronensis]|uniref:Gamma-glutamylcyclotransferase n=1 Tax=Halarcobacter ebronensis TaxID=1462615 RepID=A0A4Q0YIH0_9BACT|nr:gamma-glutamylcyclotransferase [Halarcobacter ebronensis]RXJ70075.1 gamma-glutamylcyclotransferase [Halarcobacter ebronensis]